MTILLAEGPIRYVKACRLHEYTPLIFWAPDGSGSTCALQDVMLVGAHTHSAARVKIDGTLLPKTLALGRRRPGVMRTSFSVPIDMAIPIIQA